MGKRKTKLEKLLSILPGYDPYDDCKGFVFEEWRAVRAIEFFETCLTHVKGEKAGEPVLLEDWQKALVANIFGWVDAQGNRRFREVFIYVPRKNGKTLITSGLSLFVLFCDGEEGAEVYAAAAEREQARLLFDVAKVQVLKDEVLSESCQVLAHKIEVPETNSVFKPISADANTKHGFNAHCYIVDEVHAQKDSELCDVLETSTGSRRQPLRIYLTTADYDRESFCNDKLEYAKMVMDKKDPRRDARFLPCVYAADEADDWTDPEVWKKANPNYGVSVFEDYIQEACTKAQNVPSFENTFKRLHLNLKTSAAKRWISLKDWDDCAGKGKKFQRKSLAGEVCYGGLDLANTADITALSLLFPQEDGSIRALAYFWIPEETARLKQKLDRVPYVTWEKQKRVMYTPGRQTDYREIRKYIKLLGQKYQIQEIAFDRWNAAEIVQNLGDDGFDMVDFGQGYASMNTPTKELERLVLAGGFHHNANPVLRWMAGNTVTREDPAGNIKPDKSKSSHKIDGIVASIMALGRIITAAGDEYNPENGLPYENED